MRSLSKCLTSLLLIFLTAHTTYATLQFVAKNSTTTNNLSFASLSSSNLTLVPLHASTNGWRTVQFQENAILFFEDSSPLAFVGGNEDDVVSRIFIVASISQVSPLATLIDTPTPIRFEISQEWSTLFPLEDNSNLLVDGEINAQPSGSLQLFELAFDEPISVDEIFIGNHPATPTWKRGWQGEICEIILCDENINPNQILSIRSYLAQKWDLLRQPSNLPNEYEILKAMGLRVGNVYKTLMELR